MIDSASSNKSTGAIITSEKTNMALIKIVGLSDELNFGLLSSSQLWTFTRLLQGKRDVNENLIFHFVLL